MQFLKFAKHLSVTAALLGSVTAYEASDAQTATTGKPQLGRCYMGDCSWSREQSRTVVRSSSVGRLLRLSLIGGTSADRRNSSIRWERRPHDVFVFCSTALPSVFMPTAGGMQVDVLDFENGPPGILESSANLYVHACHGPQADWGQIGFARRYGYRAIPDEFQDVTIRSPDEIFAVAQRAAVRRSK